MNPACLFQVISEIVYQAYQNLSDPVPGACISDRMYLRELWECPWMSSAQSADGSAWTDRVKEDRRQ